jgi:hypothetical protein
MSSAASVLFCADPLGPSRVDAFFGAQAEAVRSAGASIALIDHDALLAGDPEKAVRSVPPNWGPAWYRGWMIPAQRYAELEAALAVRSVALRVPADDYRLAHELPGWYDAFVRLTPRSVWRSWSPCRTPDPATVGPLIAPLAPGPGVVKDFVKSRKYEWATACFIPELADLDAATRVIATMVALQGRDLNGGIVVRRFEHFGEPQVRVWWLDAVPVLVGPHPDTPAFTAMPSLDDVGSAVAALGCRFVTTDLAPCPDGGWRVVEVGDGQVSDLPTGLDPMLLMSRLAEA